MIERAQKMSKPDVKEFIADLEKSMSEVIKAEDTAKAERLNGLIGLVIDIYTSK